MSEIPHSETRGGDPKKAGTDVSAYRKYLKSIGEGPTEREQAAQQKKPDQSQALKPAPEGWQEGVDPSLPEQKALGAFDETKAATPPIEADWGAEQQAEFQPEGLFKLLSKVDNRIIPAILSSMLEQAKQKKEDEQFMQNLREAYGQIDELKGAPGHQEKINAIQAFFMEHPDIEATASAQPPAELDKLSQENLKAKFQRDLAAKKKIEEFETDETKPQMPAVG